MALRDGDKVNFETLQKVFEDGNQCLMECETVDGKYVAVICAATEQEDGSMLLQPFARLFLGDPQDEIIPPVELGKVETR
jgi:hypothetical protein